jgi:PEP-CTERM motif
LPRRYCAPDAFANGTDISNAFAGVTLSTVHIDVDVNDIVGTGSVFAVDDANATTGARTFGQAAGNPAWGNGDFEYLLAVFAVPVSSVSLDFFANDSDDANPQLLAFDSGGNQIDIDQVLGDVVQGQPVTLTVTGAIVSIRAYWDEIDRAQNGGLDNLRYVVDGVQVPEPTGLALLGAALAGLGLLRRRRA